jgi:16S rRNA (cytosine967-C5)-methyltransferase
MLDAVAPLVRKGGILVYSTCSLEEEENWQQVSAFLRRHPNFQLQAFTKEECVAQGIPFEVISEHGCVETLPHLHGGVDGAFAARMVRL